MNAPATFFDKILTFAGDEIRPEYQPQSIGLILPSVGKLCYTKSVEYRLLIRTSKRQEALMQKAKGGINNQFLITRFSVTPNLANGRGLLDASRRSKAKKRNTRAISPAR
jgi:type I restriction enzyme M protein